jgi:hypothetical protein
MEGILKDKCIQACTEVISDTGNFIKSRYLQNKQLANTIVCFLIVLFVLLCVFILPSSTETVTITTGQNSEVISTTTTEVDHGLLDVFSLLAKIVGGVAVLYAGYIGWKRIEVSQEGQITERFTRAIDQLGSEKAEVKLGGIYSLGRIANDSKKDGIAILNILATYISERSRKTEEYTESPSDIREALIVLGSLDKSLFNDSGKLNCINKLKLNVVDLSNIRITGFCFN